MSLLFEANLSPRLIARLSSLFPGCMHVREIGLERSNDREVCQWAADNDHTLVTTDADLVEQTPAPKLIHLERGDFRFRVIEALLRDHATSIRNFENDPAAGLLVLPPKNP